MNAACSSARAEIAPSPSRMAGRGVTTRRFSLVNRVLWLTWWNFMRRPFVIGTVENASHESRQRRVSSKLSSRIIRFDVILFWKSNSKLGKYLSIKFKYEQRNSSSNIIGISLPEERLFRKSKLNCYSTTSVIEYFKNSFKDFINNNDQIDLMNNYNCHISIPIITILLIL